MFWIRVHLKTTKTLVLVVLVCTPTNPKHNFGEDTRIDLFTRYRKLGVPPTQWPETFCHVARALPDPELDRFHEWLVCPQGSPAVTGPTYVPCPEIEKVRVQLAAEADARDDEKSLPEPKPVGKGLEKPLEVGPDSL